MTITERPFMRRAAGMVPPSLKSGIVIACPVPAAKAGAGATRITARAREMSVVFVTSFSSVVLDERETPRLCRGDSQSLTAPGVG